MLTTPFHSRHQKLQARLVDFAGWEMPIQYSSIVEEHHAVRQQAGLFDIAHMGRVRIRGERTGDFLAHVTTIDANRLKSMQIRYALVTNEQGGVKDDILIYRLDEDFLCVVNGANREKIVAWFQDHSQPFGVSVDDQTFNQFMLAVQGPQAEAIVSSVFGQDIATCRYYWAINHSQNGSEFLISRTGYTGEDGFEVIGDVDFATGFWDEIFHAGQSHGMIPCGLGCRDTLRMEAGMPLYGHELTEETNPLSADLSFAVQLNRDPFVGSDVLLQVKEQGPERVRIGFTLEGKRIAREGIPFVDKAGNQIGEVTSGTFSPTLEKVIGMGYVDTDHAQEHQEMTVDLRGKPISGQVVSLPFYRRK